MNLYLIKMTGAKYKINQAVASFTWSGSLSGAARTLDISYLNAPYDQLLKLLKRPAVGDFVSVRDDGKELFYGRGYSIEKTSEAGTVTVHCIDNVQYLLKSQAKYKFRNISPELIASKILNEFQMPSGHIEQTGINIKKMVVQDESLYDIIKKAYRKAHKLNGKKYYIFQEDRKICIGIRGEPAESGGKKVCLSEDSSITGSSYSETTEEIINRVVIYNEKGKRIGLVENGKSEQKYGIFQAVYEKEDGVPEQAGAKALLEGPSQSLSVESIGNLSCLSGKSVRIRDSATGQTGKYWITSDTHTFENGTHTMSLELEFKNVEGT